MKKSLDMLGLPIINITEGKEIGISKALVIDAAQGIVTALAIEDEDWFLGVKVLPYTSVIAIGDDAITITSSESILTLEEATEFKPLLTANIKVIGTKVITKTGSIYGTVEEIIIDDNGRIACCKIKTPAGNITEVSSEQVSVFGKQVTVIDSEIPAKEGDSVQTTDKATLEPSVTVDTIPKAPVDKLAEEKNRRCLLGKKASCRIVTDKGFVIVEAGADITEEVLQKAKLANKFVELSSNIQ